MSTSPRRSRSAGSGTGPGSPIATPTVVFKPASGAEIAEATPAPTPPASEASPSVIGPVPVMPELSEALTPITMGKLNGKQRSVSSSRSKGTETPSQPADVLPTPVASSDAPSPGVAAPVTHSSKKKSKIYSREPLNRDAAGIDTLDRPKTRGRIGYLGVSRTFDGRYKAQILALGSMLQLGEFDLEEEAARAYDMAALKHHKKDARLNFNDSHLSESSEDEHNDRCEVCSVGGNMLCCDFCTLVFHMSCLKPPLHRVPPGEWMCPACAIEKERGPVSCPHCGESGITTVDDFKPHGDQRCVQNRVAGADLSGDKASGGTTKSPRGRHGRRVHPDGIKRKPGRPPKHPRPVSVTPAPAHVSVPEDMEGYKEEALAQMVTRTKKAKDRQAMMAKESKQRARKRAKTSPVLVPARSVSPKYVVHGEVGVADADQPADGVQAVKRKREDRVASRYRGVVQRSNGWLSQVKIDGITRRVGPFDNVKEAAVVYDREVVEARGDRGIVNFPENYPSLFQPSGKGHTEEWILESAHRTHGLWCDICLDEPDIEDCEQCGCRVCFSKLHPDTLLLCDVCNKEWHMQCLHPPLVDIPPGNWFCPLCLSNPRIMAAVAGSGQARNSSPARVRRNALSTPTGPGLGAYSFALVDELDADLVVPTMATTASPSQPMKTMVTRPGKSKSHKNRGDVGALRDFESSGASPMPGGLSLAQLRSPRARRGSPHGLGTLFHDTPREGICASTLLDQRRTAAMIRCGINLDVWDSALTSDRPLGGESMSVNDASHVPSGDGEALGGDGVNDTPGGEDDAVKAVSYAPVIVDNKTVDKCITDIAALAGGGMVDTAALDYVLAYGSRSQLQRVLNCLHEQDRKVNHRHRLASPASGPAASPDVPEPPPPHHQSTYVAPVHSESLAVDVTGMDCKPALQSS